MYFNLATTGKNCAPIRNGTQAAIPKYWVTKTDPQRSLKKKKEKKVPEIDSASLLGIKYGSNERINLFCKL